MNLRLVNKYIRSGVDHPFGKQLVANRTIFPTFSSVARFLALLEWDPDLVRYVREVTLVGEGFRMHEHGYDWAWERLVDAEGVQPTEKDKKIMEWANDEHIKEMALNGSYVNGGNYRTMLGKYLLPFLW